MPLQRDVGFRIECRKGARIASVWGVLCAAQLLKILKAESMEQLLLKWYSSQYANKERYIHHPNCCFPSVALPSRQRTLTPPSILRTVGFPDLGVTRQEKGRISLQNGSSFLSHITSDLSRTPIMLTGHDGEYRSLRHGLCPHSTVCLVSKTGSTESLIMLLPKT